MGAGPAECSRTRVRAGSGGAGEHEQDDGHGQAAGGHHRCDATDDPEQDRAATTTVGAGPPHGRQRVQRERPERDPDDDRHPMRATGSARCRGRSARRSRTRPTARARSRGTRRPATGGSPRTAWAGRAGPRGETMLWRPVRGSRLDIGAKRSRARWLSRPGPCRRSCGGRSRRCTTAVAGSAPRRSAVRPRRTPRRGTPARRRPSRTSTSNGRRGP